MLREGGKEIQRAKGTYKSERTLPVSQYKGLITKKLGHCLAGEVVGGPNQVPVENVKVVFRKKKVDRTNEEGEFSFAVTDEVDRLTVTFQDPADQFSETTQTMPFQRGRTVFHRIVLQKEDPPVIFDSSKDLRVPLGHAGDNMAELELPADNLLDKDGKPFKGHFSSLGVCEKAVFPCNCERTQLPIRCFLFACFLVVPIFISLYSGVLNNGFLLNVLNAFFCPILHF